MLRESLGPFSPLFNVAASRPAQMTTSQQNKPCLRLGSRGNSCSPIVWRQLGALTRRPAPGVVAPVGSQSQIFMETAPGSVLFEDESASLLFGNAFGLLGREKIDVMLQRRMIRARDTIEREPDAAGEPGLAARTQGLSRPRQLSAGQKPDGCRAIAEFEIRRNQLERRRCGSGTRLRLCHSAP